MNDRQGATWRSVWITGHGPVRSPYRRIYYQAKVTIDVIGILQFVHDLPLSALCVWQVLPWLSVLVTQEGILHLCILNCLSLQHPLLSVTVWVLQHHQAGEE